MNALIKAIPSGLKVTLVVTLVKAIVKLTPTEKDDLFIEEVEKGLKKAGIEL